MLIQSFKRLANSGGAKDLSSRWEFRTTAEIWQIKVHVIKARRETFLINIYIEISGGRKSLNVKY